MSLLNQGLMYEFQAKDLTQAEAIKQFSDHVVKEIKSLLGWDTEVEIHIHPEAKDKRVYSVSLGVYGLGDAVVVKKAGKNVMSILRKVRKTVLRQVHRLTKKQISYRRRHFLRAQPA